MPMLLRSILRRVAASASAVILTPFLQAPATKLAEKLHFDLFFSERWEPLMQWLSDLTASPWYLFVAGSVAGFAAGLWVDWLLRSGERPLTQNVIHDAIFFTIVEIRFDINGPTEMYVDIEIINPGYATVLTGWKASLVSKGKTLIQLPPRGFHVPYDPILGRMSDNDVTKRAIESGGRQEHMLMFTIQGNAKTIFDKKGNKVVISASDVRGVEIKDEYKF